MSDLKSADENTEWLHSPLSEKSLRLQPMRELFLRPYYGSRRQVKIFRTTITIGQGPGCDITIADPFISPLHAELRLAGSGDGYSVHDLSSRNGVFLNGVRVVAAPLPSQGTLRIGRSTLSWCDSIGDSEILEEGWVVADPAMREVLQSLKRVARSTLPVLLLGETGTGKDILARMLHRWGAMAGGPYVPVNGALMGGTLAESELFGHRKGSFTGAETNRIGALRSAHGGTLFLDEVADVPACAQVKLLRALETGEIKALGSDRPERAEFRLVSATSRNLEKKMLEGTFRNDLYYRIAGFVIHVPPLRERPLDTLAISRKFAHDHGMDIEKEAENRLLTYKWPGNVRELRSCIERAAVMARAQRCARILAEHLVGLVNSLPLNLECEAKPRTLDELEKQIIQSSLERNGWSRLASARELGIARSSLYGKMRRFGLGSVIKIAGKATAPLNSG